MIGEIMETYPSLTWLAAGLVLLVVEMLAPGVFMMWLGLAAIGIGTLVHFVDIGFAWQVVVFGALALAFIGAAMRLRRPKPATRLNTAARRPFPVNTPTRHPRPRARSIAPAIPATTFTARPWCAS